MKRARSGVKDKRLTLFQGVLRKVDKQIAKFDTKVKEIQDRVANTIQGWSEAVRAKPKKSEDPDGKPGDKDTEMDALMSDLKKNLKAMTVLGTTLDAIATELETEDE